MAARSSASTVASSSTSSASDADHSLSPSAAAASEAAAEGTAADLVLCLGSAYVRSRSSGHSRKSGVSQLIMYKLSFVMQTSCHLHHTRALGSESGSGGH